MSNRKKSNPVRVMLCWTIAFAVLAFAAWFGADVIADYSATRLDKMQAEVDEYNAKQDQAYALALSEYEQAKSAGTNLAWPTPDNEGWDVVDLTNYPLENLGTVTTTRSCRSTVVWVGVKVAAVAPAMLMKPRPELICHW